MTTAKALDYSTEPLVIHRSVNRDGQTFSLDPATRRRLQEQFGEQVRVHPRLFIAHETKADYDSVRIDLVDQVAQLLTGLSIARLSELGVVELRDAVTEHEVPTRPR